MADVLPHEVVARGDDQMPLPHVAEEVEDPRHPHGDGRLPGARAPGEAHVEGRALGRETGGLAQLREEQQAGDLAHATLDRLEADQVAIEFRERRVDRRLAERRVEVDEAVEGSRHAVIPVVAHASDE